MSLKTGRELHGYEWTEVPIDDSVIARVEEMAEAEGQPTMVDGPIFEWSPGVPILDDDEDEEELNAPMADFEYDYNVDSEVEENDSDESDSEGSNSEDNDSEDSDTDEINEENENRIGDEEDGLIVTASENNTDESDAESTEDDTTDASESDEESDNDTVSDESKERKEAETKDRSKVRSERPRRANAGAGIVTFEPFMSGKSHDKQFTSTDDNKQFTSTTDSNEPKRTTKIDDCYRLAVNVAFTQMSASKGIKTYGERAVAAMFKEYRQLNDLEVFGPVNPDTLTKDEKRLALRAINLIKEKRCGKIKGRTVADGRPTRKYIPREEAASPTIALESLFASLLIDAHEDRAVQIFDVPGAYLHADLPDDKYVLLKLEGTFVDIMCEVNPEYLKDVRYENGKKTLYLRILKAIYGMIESALLWYDLYSTTLKEMGFEINPYDRCVANKVIDGKQCTVCWYVDDNKVSHVDDKVNDMIVDKVEEKFGKLARSKGKKHTFLGMDIEFIGNGKLTIATPQHIEEAIEKFGEDLSTDAVNPAKSKLFTVTTDSMPLSEPKADTYHSVTATVLWLCKRSRPDLETAVSFLCTRVQAPTLEDWGKLRRLLKFLKRTKDDIRVMGADNMLKLETWVDASHATHANMRGHTGGTMSFGWGVVHEKSAKQKINTKSTTESEVVALSEYVPHTILMTNLYSFTFRFFPQRKYPWYFKTFQSFHTLP